MIKEKSLNTGKLNISKFEGFSGIRLLNDKPLKFESGINLIVGRNGCGKTNLLRLIQFIITGKPDLKDYLESTFIQKHGNNFLNNNANMELITPEEFGRVPVVTYRYGRQEYSISLELKTELPRHVFENELRNVGRNNNNFVVKGDNLRDLSWQGLYSDRQAQNFEVSISPNIRPIHTLHEDKIKLMIEGSINLVNDLVESNYIEFFRSEVFQKQLKNLQDAINEKLRSFLGQTNKHIKIRFDPTTTGHEALVFCDGNNVITPEKIGDGERVLLNLIFALTEAKEKRTDFLSFDEPDIYMHDDMIQVLVDELQSITMDLSGRTLLIATHSAALIDRLARLGNETINLILFDENKNVYNSQGDVDFIKALNRNGVWFTPLMLSKKPNIFIENQGKDGEFHRDYLLKFFEANNQPNIIPIGSGASVEQSDSFAEEIRNLVNETYIKSFGIRDGDLWIKEKLIDYLWDDITTDELLRFLSGNNGFVVTQKSKRKNEYFFNFWEIENLYLMDEVIKCWKSENISMTISNYRKFLTTNSEKWASEFLEVLYKKELAFRNEKRLSLHQKLNKLEKKLDRGRQIKDRVEELQQKALTLVQALVDHDLTQWLPGKEVVKELKNSKYVFNDSELDHPRLELATRVRELLHL